MKRLKVISLLLVLLVAGAVTVYAAGNISVGARQWDGTNHTWAVSVTQLSNPDKYVCLYYTRNNSTLIGRVDCDCPTPPCDNYVGTWICTLPGAALPNSTVDWEIDCATSAACGGDGTGCTGAATGTFETSPNAVVLSSLSASPLLSAAVPWLLGAGMLFIGVIVLVWSRRR